MIKAEGRQITRIVGENLRNLRVSNKYSQADFARLLGVTQATVSHFEKGEREPGLDFLFMVADRFSIPVTALIPIKLSGMPEDESAVATGLIRKNPAWIKAFDQAHHLTDYETNLVISLIDCLAKGETPNEP